jgi:hypothetical protein
LQVEILGWNESGTPVPWQGTVQTTLHGRDQRIVRSYGNQFFGEPGLLRELGSWTRLVDTDDPSKPASAPGTARVVLPLAEPYPDHDAGIFPIGELHVRLAVPGQGVFEASKPAITLKNVSPERAQNFVENGSLMLPGETTSGNIRRTPLWREWSSLTPRSRIFSVQP